MSGVRCAACLQKMNNNVRYNIMATKTLHPKTKIPTIWKEFVQYHVSADFYKVRHAYVQLNLAQLCALCNLQWYA